MGCRLMEITTRVIYVFKLFLYPKQKNNPNFEKTHINFKEYKRSDNQKLEKIRKHFGTLMSKHTSNRIWSNTTLLHFGNPRVYGVHSFCVSNLLLLTDLLICEESLSWNVHLRKRPRKSWHMDFPPLNPGKCTDFEIILNDFKSSTNWAIQN